MRAIAQPINRGMSSRSNQIRRAGGSASRTTELVCVVDDDQSVRRGLRRLFKSAEYAAETFASAEDYLAREIFEGPICLVLDVRMPGLNGLELQKELESRGACEQIVFITGHNDVPTCTQAMKNGAVDFLMKPFDSEELIEAVKRALERGKEHLHKRGQRRDARARVDKLTPREFEDLRVVIIVLVIKKIAVNVDQGRKAVKVHICPVMCK